MTYKGHCFNSSGMFEIQGEANGKPIRIRKPLEIEYLGNRPNNRDEPRLPQI